MEFIVSKVRSRRYLNMIQPWNTRKICAYGTASDATAEPWQRNAAGISRRFAEIAQERQCA